jgi:hypothetical protein
VTREGGDGSGSEGERAAVVEGRHYSKWNIETSLA